MSEESKELETTKTEAEIELDKQQDKYGRKTVMTPSVLVKLEQAFALGCTDIEACFYAGIGESTLYDYLKANPDFSERKKELKMKPVLLARQSVMKGIVGHEIKDTQGNVIKVINKADPYLAWKYLEKKMHNEFKTGVALTDNVVHNPDEEREFYEKWGKLPKTESTPLKNDSEEN